MESNSRNSGWWQLTDKNPDLHSSKCDKKTQAAVLTLVQSEMHQWGVYCPIARPLSCQCQPDQIERAEEGQADF